jgi:hypothetical protein
VDDSMMARSLGRSTMAWAPGKCLAGNFGRLTARVKASEDEGLQRSHNGLFRGEPHFATGISDIIIRPLLM